MDKNDEMVWVIPRNKLEFYRDGNPILRLGSCKINPEFVDVLTRFTSYRRRGDVENDRGYVQIIPYCTVVSLSDVFPKILVYNRGSAGGEKRLSDKWSIGVGGHIQPDDAKEATGMGVVHSAARRELLEELVGVSGETLNTVAGETVFYRDDTPVSAVHLGVWCSVVVPEKAVSAMGDGIVDFQWSLAEDLYGKYFLEDWSWVVLSRFLHPMLSRMADCGVVS